MFQLRYEYETAPGTVHEHEADGQNPEKETLLAPAWRQPLTSRRATIIAITAAQYYCAGTNSRFCQRAAVPRRASIGNVSRAPAFMRRGIAVPSIFDTLDRQDHATGSIHRPCRR